MEDNKRTEVWALDNIKVDIEGIIWRNLDLAQKLIGIVFK